MWKRWFWWIFPRSSIIYRYWILLYTSRWYTEFLTYLKYIHSTMLISTHPLVTPPIQQRLDQTVSSLRRAAEQPKICVVSDFDEMLEPLAEKLQGRFRWVVCQSPCYIPWWWLVNKDPKLRICTVIVWNSWIVLIQLDVIPLEATNPGRTHHCSCGHEGGVLPSTGAI